MYKLICTPTDIYLAQDKYLLLLAAMEPKIYVFLKQSLRWVS